jgi:hypothetical protein
MPNPLVCQHLQVGSQIVEILPPGSCFGNVQFIEQVHFNFFIATRVLMDARHVAETDDLSRAIVGVRSSFSAYR